MVVQDSEKHYILCGQCEDLFSENETYFANQLFHSYLKKVKIVFDYDERLFYFLTSVSWRSLYLDLLDFVESNVVGIDTLENLIRSEKIMREYLLHQRNDIGTIENHIFFFDDIREIESGGNWNIENLRPHVSFHRGLISYTFCYESEETYGTITNMMGIVILTFYRLGKDERWENTKVVNGIGRIEARNQRIASVAGNEFHHIMQVAQKASVSMSEAQENKIAERLKKVGATIKDSPVYKDWVNDAKLINNKD